MFKCFTDSLVRPKNIISNISMKNGKFILYLIILIFISSITSIIDGLKSNAVPEQYSKMIVSELKDIDHPLNYKIENNQLINTSNNNSLIIIGIDNFTINGGQLANQSALPIYICFNIENKSLTTVEEIKAPSLVVNLLSDKFEVYMHVSNNQNVPSGGTQLMDTDPIINETYKNVNANGINFSQVHSYSTYELELRIEKVISKSLESYLFLVNLTSLPVTLFVNATSLLLEIAMLAAIVYLFFRGINLKFVELFKLITFCMTPTVVLNIFMALPFGNGWYLSLYIIGQILTIAYFYIAYRELFISKIRKE